MKNVQVTIDAVTLAAVDRVANLARTSYAQVDNLQTVAKARFVKYLGALDASAMRTVGRTLILALGLEDLA